MDLSLGHLLRLDLLDHDLAVVVDRVEGTVDTADRAVDAELRLDLKALLARGDRVGGADSLTDATGRALGRDEVSFPLPVLLELAIAEQDDLVHAVCIHARDLADDLAGELEGLGELVVLAVVFGFVQDVLAQLLQVSLVVVEGVLTSN